LLTKDITIDIASKMLKSLYNSIQETHDSHFEDLIENVKKTANEMEISPEFLEKQRHGKTRMIREAIVKVQY